MRIKFTIPGRLPGMNEYTAAQRSHPLKGAQMKKREQARVEWAVKAAHLPASVHPVKLHFRFYEPNRKRDLDNISGFAHKVIQDALVSCGVLGGDGWKYVTGYTDEFFVDKDSPRIEVEIQEIT